MRLIGLHIENFGNLKDFHIGFTDREGQDFERDALSPLTFLLGNNGSGKTMLFRALRMLGELPNEHIKQIVRQLGSFVQISTDDKKAIVLSAYFRTIDDSGDALVHYKAQVNLFHWIVQKDTFDEGGSYLEEFHQQEIRLYERVWYKEANAQNRGWKGLVEKRHSSDDATSSEENFAWERTGESSVLSPASIRGLENSEAKTEEQAASIIYLSEVSTHLSKFRVFPFERGFTSMHFRTPMQKKINRDNWEPFYAREDYDAIVWQIYRAGQKDKQVVEKLESFLRRHLATLKSVVFRVWQRPVFKEGEETDEFAPDPTIRFYFVNRGGFSLEQLSEGTLRLINLFLLTFNLPESSVVGIEEPENGIYLENLARFSEELTAKVEDTKDCLMLISTHNPEFIIGAEPESVWHLGIDAEGYGKAFRISENKKFVSLIRNGYRLEEIWKDGYFDKHNEIGD